MSTPVPAEEDHTWTRSAILALGVVFEVFMVLLVIGMVTHQSDRPTILHSWNDFYNWVINSNFAGIALGLLIPTIPLAALAEYHHRRTVKRLRAHNALLEEHHQMISELHHFMRTGERPDEQAD